MGRPLRIDPRRIGARSCRRALAAGLALSLASCAEIATVADVVFPSSVPGLPADQPWESLPIRRWLTDSPIEPVAISACFTCSEPAVAGLFRSRGEEAASMRQAAADPAALVAMLTREKPPGHRSGKTASRSRVEAEPAQEGGAPGLLVRMARKDGSRKAAGYVAALDRGGETQLLVIVARSEATARALARNVVPRL